MTIQYTEETPTQNGLYVAFTDTLPQLPVSERKLLYFKNGKWYYPVQDGKFSTFECPELVFATIGPLPNFFFEREIKMQSGRKATNSTAAKSLGSKGGKKGGPARAKALTSTERSRIASEGGKAKAKNTKVTKGK